VRTAGKYPESLQAHVSRFQGAHCTTSRCRGERRAPVPGATGLFRELAVPFHLGVTELELAEFLVRHGRDEDAGPLLAEARVIFERLEAQPWLDRVDSAEVGSRPVTHA
jgi:hypothetical protein